MTVPIANAMIFHCGRPQGHKQAGQAGLLVPVVGVPIACAMTFHCERLQGHQMPL